MRWETKAERSKRKANYLPDPFWFAWYPVTARDENGHKIRVWWEVVRMERFPYKYENRYGGICREVRYYYYTVPEDKLPPYYRRNQPK